MGARQVVVITGASSGFGRLTAEALARDGHAVVAGMRSLQGRNQTLAHEIDDLSKRESIEISAVELDVQSQESVDDAIAQAIAEHGQIDVVVHNAGHMVLGPTEAFTPEQLAALYDVNVVGTQRVNRAVLPHLRSRQSGLLVWVGSSSTRGGHPPFLAPYFAAKAGMDVLAESYAAELIRYGIDTTIVVPGAFTSGTNHFQNAGSPDDVQRVADYQEVYGQLLAETPERLGAIVPDSADAQTVADEIMRVINLPRGKRPFRTHVDPAKDGSEVGSAVADRLRVEFYHRVGMEDLLSEHASL